MEMTADQARDQWTQRVIEHATWAHEATTTDAQLHNLAEALAYAEAALREAVTHARATGHTWQQIATATAAVGISSRQAAQQRWGA